MIKYDLLFVCTSSNDILINKLLKSVSGNNNKLNVLVVVLLQSGININISEYSNDFLNIIKFQINNKIGLSSARNICLKYIYENSIVFDHVMFPDDDSTYDDEFFNKYLSIVNLGKSYLIDVKCEGTNILYVSNNAKEGDLVSVSNYHMAMSVNMIISVEVLNAQLLFDENLGVGTKYGSAEDSDFFIRCVKKSEPFYYSKILYNSHPSPSDKYAILPFRSIVKRFRNYGNGVIYALCKHKLYFMAIIICLRAIGGIFYNLLQFRFKLASAYFISFFYRTSLLIYLFFSNTTKSNQID